MTFKQHLSMFVALVAGAISMEARADFKMVVDNGQAIRIVQTEDFCRRINGVFLQFADSVGLNRGDGIQVASNGVTSLLAGFQQGRASLYLDPTELSKKIRVAEGRERQYLVVSRIMGAAMGIQTQSIDMALSASELRFLPHAQSGSEIVLIAQNANALNPNQLKNVVDTARRLNIKIHVVWVGRVTKSNAKSLQGEARAMASLASSTGGAFADLSTINGCGAMI